MKIMHKTPYQPLRAAAYPHVGEQLDAVYKLAVALQNQGIELPPETQEWIQKCQSVKEKYKKK